MKTDIKNLRGFESIPDADNARKMARNVLNNLDESIIDYNLETIADLIHKEANAGRMELDYYVPHVGEVKSNELINSYCERIKKILKRKGYRVFLSRRHMNSRPPYLEIRWKW